MKVDEKDVRRQKVKQALSLKRLMESQDHVDMDRSGERELARSKYLELIEKYHILPEEILLGFGYSEATIKKAKERFGYYYRYVLFGPYWGELDGRLPSNPYMNIGDWNGFDEEGNPAIKQRVSIPEAGAIQFGDKALEEALRGELGLPDKAPISQEEAFKVKRLNLSKKGIKRLSGLEHFRNLEVLNLRGNPISECVALEDLTNLRRINLSDTRIKHFEPLSSLKLLRTADLSRTGAKDFTAVFRLKLLSVLYVPWGYDQRLPIEVKWIGRGAGRKIVIIKRR